MSQFAIFTCQAGAEAPLKAEIAAIAPQWTPAFSRPGVVTMKNQGDDIVESSRLPPLVFARTRAISLGRLTGESLPQLCGELDTLLSDASLPTGPKTLHVWQRETQLPGDEDYEPGVSALAEQIRGELLMSTVDQQWRDSPSGQVGQLAVDVVMVEPNEWLVGWHRIADRRDRWPGGFFPVESGGAILSRAYLKLAEALAWSQLPASPGELWVELGCAPGGASQCLLEREYAVIGVDPAEVDPWLAEQDSFLHLQMRAADVPKKELQEVRWLAADINVAPRYTLDAAESIVTSKSKNVRGMVLTLKLSGWHLATHEKLENYVRRVQSWGFKDVRIKQLAHNRHEVCLIALRSRSQRRVRR